jgi:antitoxin PrlF
MTLITPGELPMPTLRKLSMVQAKGQVTIPREIRQKLNIKKGDLVTFIETEQGVVIQPAEVVVASALDEIGRALKERGITLEEMIDRGREIRGELTDQKYGRVPRSK